MIGVDMANMVWTANLVFERIMAIVHPVHTMSIPHENDVNLYQLKTYTRLSTVHTTCVTPYYT